MTPASATGTAPHVSRRVPRGSALVIQTSFLGDMVLTTPLLTYLAASSAVDVVCTPAASVLLENHPAVREVIVYDKRGRDRGALGATRLAMRLRPLLPDVTVSVYHDLETIVRESDVLITTTASREPLIKGEWLRGGQHITAVGADDQTKCELDAECFRRADRVIVDSLESNANNGDVFRHLSRRGIVLEQVHGEIGGVLSGELDGRRMEHEITIAKFVGVGVQDLVAAEVTLAKLGVHGAVPICYDTSDEMSLLTTC